MVITDETNTTVSPGLTLAAHLQAELDAFAVQGNAPGAALLGPLIADQSFSVTIKTAGATATSGKRVTVNTGQTNGHDKEFVESVIFELTNASNFAAFATLDSNLKAGTVPIRTYGERKAVLEAEASWNLAQILNARGGYAPSAFGQGHVATCGANLLGAYGAIFRALPHDANAVPNTVMRLPSEEMYAYNGALIVAGTNNFLKVCFPIVDKRPYPQKNIVAGKLKDAVPGGAQLISSFQPANCARFYSALVESLKALPANVSVTWGGGNSANWEFTAGMKLVAPDANSEWKTKIDGWISQKNPGIYP